MNKSSKNPRRVPGEEPLDPTDLRNQSTLQTGPPDRWLVPSSVLAAITIVLFALALRQQVVLPLVGIVFVVGTWTAMFIIARRGGHRVRTNRVLAWLMGGLAVGALLVALGIYVVESFSAAT